MPTPITMIPSKPRLRRKRRRPGAPAPVAALTLVAAMYDAGDAQVWLTFDRAVNIDAIVPGQVTVADGPGGVRFEGTGAELILPEQVLITLQPAGAASGADVTLTATAATGIVAADDGAAWAGASGVELPFGPQ